ncbi:hypothetical protein POJ06DRAFT_260912 [Lipomyces tetrasporus]|uniref:Uncharacterized protein n=1 Tax=Lipomyces tetrasporus TaxID=54092 RepID=A0AAD7VQ70_9ASCO|nr:uncharacterized protein POJ06DRAFT_260912 [Lipomyces tetrasporus]KAJ8097254.1 hypothetical protein POJ06DRAFT_260912 [Lipomyces tetrasporus]
MFTIYALTLLMMVQRVLCHTMILQTVTRTGNISVSMRGSDYDITCPEGIFGYPFMPRNEGGTGNYRSEYGNGTENPMIQSTIDVYNYLNIGDVAAALQSATTPESAFLKQIVNGQNVFNSTMTISNCSQVLLDMILHPETYDGVHPVQHLIDESANHADETASTTSSNSSYTSEKRWSASCHNNHGAYRCDCAVEEAWIQSNLYYDKLPYNGKQKLVGYLQKLNCYRE